MKKVLLLATLAATLLSCTKNADQIESAKKKLLELGEDNAVVEKLKFDVHEVFDKDVYKKIEKKLTKDAEDLKDVGAYPESTAKLEEVSAIMDLRDKATNKTFYIVQAYRVEGDTLNKSEFYLDDKNNVLNFRIIK